MTGFNFLSSLALDIVLIVHLSQTLSVTVRTIFTKVHPKIEFENCNAVTSLLRVFSLSVKPEQFLCNLIADYRKFLSSRMMHGHHAAK